MVLLSCKKDEQVIESKESEQIIQDSLLFCSKVTFTTINTTVPNMFISAFFLTEKDGFVGSYDGTIYKTTDSAKTWTSLNSTTNLPIRDIYFVDSQNGFAVGGESSCGGTGCEVPGGFILRTQNAGQTWKRIFTPSKKLEISSIYFVNKSVGFCIGEYVIYKTTDGGKNWTEKQINNLGGKMMKIKFSNEQNGFIVCLFDKILKTTNGGQTWQVLSPNENLGHYSLSLVDGISYISGQGKVLKSIDNGRSWNKLENSPSDIFEIHFITKNMGYAFGRGNYSGGDFGSSYGSIYCTDDGGSSWSGNGNFREVGLIQVISFPSVKTGYAVSGNKLIKVVIN
jgi:photosystem II stability/assembly factor-like uncharacterized protein